MDTHTFRSRDATQLLNSTVIRPPIAFVSTLSAEHNPNLAPFRYGILLVRATNHFIDDAFRQFVFKWRVMKRLRRDSDPQGLFDK